MTRRYCHVASLLTMTAILFSFNAQAECTPTPDCASIGYTETSCETISLKCPFDQTKLFCFPCDSSYQHTCSNANEYGNGESCKGKYKSCCNTSCSVGNIYYSDGTCNSCLDTNKTPIGVVVKNNELVISKEYTLIKWSPDLVDIAGLVNYETSSESFWEDMNGQANTVAIVEHYGYQAVDVAGVYCYNYAPAGLEGSKTKWYLPSAGEIFNYVHKNFEKINATFSNYLGFDGFSISLASSSEYDYYRALHINTKLAYNYEYGKNYNVFPTMCFLPI